MIRREDDGVEHVIVKFSPQVNTPSGRRWGDLLICEHLALQVLARNGIAAATTAILESESRVFLEVVRFDRVGLRGRLPIATFSALDGDLGMMDQNWTAVARELGRLEELSGKDILTVEILDLYMGRVELRHLSKCHDMALQFWTEVVNDPRISEDFKGVVARHVKAILPFAPAAVAN